MKLRTFSVAGEALNFGARRLETITRVAWLPVVLLLILNMATVFALLSVAYGRAITFADAPNWAAFQAALLKIGAEAAQAIATKGPLSIKPEFYYVLGTSFILQLILIASFMAPLLRYVGLGERPAPGVVRLDFGASQIRFILAGLLSSLVIAAFVLAPVVAAAFYALKYIAAALAQTYARFPNPDSLHTIELVTAQQALTERGDLWFYSNGVILIAAAPFAVVLWILLTAHFREKGASLLATVKTAFLTFAMTLAGAAAFWFGMAALKRFIVTYLLKEQEKANILAAGLLTIVSPLLAFAYLIGQALAIDQLAIVTVIVLYAYYFSLRVAPYQGVAVCRGSMAPGGTLKVTRRGNILRLFVAGFVLSAVLSVMSWLINTYLFVFIAWVTNYLYMATATATKLVNSGVEAAWTKPLFVWAWNITKILVNLFWTFFSYGVVAGYLGRLYRESERAEDAPVARAPWRHA